jgi:regulation of enolase protein 1 (concanavalin A-like superfamily)
MEPYWLRLERNGHTFIGSISPDGRSWTKVAEAKVALKNRIYAGLPVCSSLTKVTTTVMFDNVAAPGWNSSREAK